MKNLKQSKLLFIGLLLLVATSCKKTDLAPAEKLITAEASLNSGFAFNDQVNIDITAPGWIEFNSCTGSILYITSGIWHIDVHGVINKNKVSFDEHTNTQNYKLVDATTGIEYVGSYGTNYKYNATFYNGQYTVTQTLSAVLTTPGGGNNSTLKFDVHLTINANGTITAYVDNYRAGCQ